jgi:hypothetical protein
MEVKRNEISLTPVFFYSKERRRVYVLVGQPNNQRHFFWELFEIDPNDLTHALSHQRLYRTRSFLSADRQGRVTRWREPTRVDFLPGHSISLQWRIIDEKGHFVVQGSDFDF